MMATNQLGWPARASPMWQDFSREPRLLQHGPSAFLPPMRPAPARVPRPATPIQEPCSPAASMIEVRSGFGPALA
eukprot:tig00000073_g1738.t1